MAAKGKAGDVSGFDVVRAIKHVRDHEGSAPPPPKKPPPAPPAKPPEDGDEAKPAAAIKIGKTAVPTKHEYVCYECGYRFTVAGKVQTLYCAKCRTILNQADYKIDKYHDVSIVTAGTVTILPEGVWAGGTLSARDVILEGKHEGGTIRAFRRLEVAPGAEFRYDAVSAESLIIRAGATFRANAPMHYQDVSLFGELEGELTTTGLVTIHAGGHFKGHLVSKRLKVEDGGGLTADVEIQSD